ncbi:MAG: hypothetical protein ACKVOU_04810 [Cytophagales bacterium]
MPKSIFLLFFLVFFCLVSKAQNEQFVDKSTYLADIRKIVSATKNKNMIATIDRFESNYWNHQLMDDINKNKVTQISLALTNKGYNFTQQGLSFLNTLSKALDNQEMNSEKLQNFFNSVTKTIDYQEVAVLNNFFKTTSLFLEKRQLYYSFNSNIVVEEGKFDFDYTGFVAPSNEVPTADPAPVSDPFAVQENAEPVPATNIFATETTQSADGPLIKLDGVTLILLSKYDTLKINKTSGSLQLSDNQFIGSGGTIDWSTMGTDLTTAVATLKDYHFNVSKNEIKIENVTFTNPSRLEAEVQGSFEYKAPTARSYATTNYPKFTSNSNDVVINKLSKNINYVGAFSLIGRKFSSTCVDEKPSTLTYNDGKNSFQVTSKSFIFKDSSITSYPSKVMIFMGSDTIIHPGLSFSYEPKGKNVCFKREKGPFQTSIFRDTYHGLEFSVDQLDWNIASDSINLNITAAKRQIPAIFRSTNYFNANDFQKMIGVGSFHPLKILQYYQKKTGLESIYLEEVAKLSKIKIETLNGVMAEMDKKGFVQFEPISGQIVILPKGQLFLQAFAGKSDYDNLYLPSLAPVLPNATIKLGPDNVMIIRGVERFFVSDSSHVFAIPENGTVKIFQNRDIYFNGVLVAGYFLFKGSDFQLHYNDFEVKLTKIDTLKFIKSKTKSKSNTSEKQFMNNNLVYSSGTLFINDPENKSGKKNFPEFPRFDAVTGAYVYFTGKEILAGAYDRRIYFKIPPFKTDSVKSTGKSKFKFKGTFYSGDVLPTFEEQLKVMPDNSLGFNHKVPSEGYPVYNGKATFFGNLTLNNEGIRGDGYLKYLTSTWYSNDFVFYQDSLVARGAQAKITEKIDSISYFPDTDIADFELKYVPRTDTMMVTNFNYPFDLYKKQLQLDGNLYVSANGVSGSGLLEIKKERVIAPKLEFYQKKVVSRHAVLNSKLPGYTKNSLEVNNVKITFLLKESTANISPEIRGIAGISFPLCEYATSIENAKWDLNKKIVSMTAENPNDISKSYFIATNPQYDSLVFNAAAAIYDINKKQLKIDGVPFIKSADAKILPDSGKVLIVEEGQMKTLKKAIIILDTITAYHYLTKGKIQIESRYKFSGSAIYRYASQKGDSLSIPFNNFYTEEKIISKTETARYTASQGEITEKDKFYVAPRVLYKGKVKLVATKQSLIFDGLVKMEIHNKELSTDWIPYQHDGTTKEFVLQLTPKVTDASKPKKDEKAIVNISEAGSPDTLDTEMLEPQLLYSGFFNEVGDFDLYSTLMSHRKSPDDHEIFSATGELRYIVEKDQFVVGTAERLLGNTLVGNKYIYDDTLQTLDCQGNFTLARPDLNFALSTTGEARENIKKHRYALDGMLSMKMNMPTKALDIAAKRIAEVYVDQMLVKNDTISQEQTDLLTLKIANMGGEKASKAYQKHLNDLQDYKPLFKFIPKLTEGIAFEKVNLVWSNEYKAWHSKGKLKLSNILANDINSYVDGFVEIKRTELGDMVTIVIKPNSDSYYYFNYQPGRLALLSSDADFNTSISSKSKGETGTPTVYTFVLADEAEEALFMKEFHKNYLGLNYDDLSDYKRKRDEDKAEPKIEEPSETNPEPVELAPKPAKKGKKSKKVDITKEETDLQDSVEPTSTPTKQTIDPAETNPEPKEIAPKQKKSKKQQKKTTKQDITKEESEPSQAQPAAEETNPEPVEIAPKPKKTKKKKVVVDEEGVE